MNCIHFLSDISAFAFRALDLLSEYGQDGVLIVCEDQATIPTEILKNIPWQELSVVNCLDSSLLPEKKAVILLYTDPIVLTKNLLSLRKTQDVSVLAFQTEFYFSRRPVFIQSIPKSGTHLMAECLKAFGYRAPPSFDLSSAQRPRSRDVL